MIIKSILIEKFRAFDNVSFDLGKRVTAIAGRNATQKTTVLGMIGQPFTISDKSNPMYGCKTIDGYNFRSQFREKFKISPDHDIIGEHRWTLNLHQRVYEHDSYCVESIPRKQSGKAPTLRFWNANSKSKGAGYIQLPVYFLSLSRLFPIGETGKTKAIQTQLTSEEVKYCIDSYRKILSIHNIGRTPTVGIERAASSKTFAGVSDDIHDIFTNSAGEGNIIRIILAVLSFRKLKEKHGRNYNGGILLIDELDATLYGFSQNKLVDYLWEAAGEYKIQIVFTTHSPILLKRVNKYMREEAKVLGMGCPAFAYSASIVYLKPTYNDDGKRFVVPQNVRTSRELNEVLNDINLDVSRIGNRINVYCEDARAASFLQYILTAKLPINIGLYMSFVDINLGWTNYVQLASKRVPEFLDNLIVLDGDVPTKPEYVAKESAIRDAGNFLFLPLVIEKGIFELLKDFARYSKFSETLSRVEAFSYDVCFRDYTLDASEYDTKDFKSWYEYVLGVIGNQEALFEFWCRENADLVDGFVVRFVELFNRLADKADADALPIGDESNGAPDRD